MKLLSQKLLLLFFLLWGLLPVLAHAAPSSPSANRECATCHIMWLTDFKREDIETLVPYDPKPVVNTGKQDIASTEDICFSCHDGFVLESRELWQKGKHAHPVGQKPSSKIIIPKEDGKNIFPLNDDGRMYCGTCHTAHGVDWDDKESTLFMRTSDVDGKLCMACHQDKSQGASYGNHPVLKKIESIPDQLSATKAKFGRENKVVCQSCHQPHAAPEKKILRLKNKNSELCGSCHDDRYANNIAEAASMKTHPVNIKAVHVQVPETLVKNGSKLGDDKKLICQSCHQPHDAKTKTGLLVDNNHQGALCQQCHTDKKTVLNTKHDMTLLEEDSKNSRQQSVNEAGVCSACHLPHKGEGAKMWARKIDAEQEPMAALCLSCHSEEGLAEKHTVGEFSHPVGVDVKKLGRKIPLPTFGKDGVKWQDVMQGKVSCASCHDPHQWDANDKHHKARPGDKSDNTNRFLRIANGADATLCKTCHQEKWNIAGSKHDMRLMAPDSKNTQGQSVKQSGLCGVCHLVHNANGSKLWARAKLEGQGTGYVACIGCHNEKGLAKNKTLGAHSHPLNVGVERLGIDARDDNWVLAHQSAGHSSTAITALPLYDHNGLPAEQDGHVGCGTCHDPHNWSVTENNAEHEQDVRKLEGDANNSFLRIADNGTSELCVNCHQDKKSVFLTRHDLSDQEVLPKSLPRASHTNADDDDQLSSQRNVTGACQHCHTPHNAGPNALFSRKPGEGNSPNEKMCASCHQKDNLAGKKLPGNHTHPVGVSIGDLHTDKSLPLFDSEGNRDGYRYLVDCASCHNPHEWDPDRPMNRGLSLLAEEGDTSNSFLRASANNNSELCVRCHTDKKLIIGTDHDFEKDTANTLGQKRDVSGACGQCHVPHHGESADYLWAQPLGEGQDGIEQRCRSCHADGKMASSKNPQAAQHPSQIKVWSTGLRKLFRQQDQLPDIRVFDQQGRQANVGIITCASCHNPHQWQALHQHGDQSKTAPENEEGNVLNSFLRNNDSRDIVCADCHDKDGLYRYKYFHSQSTHQQQ